MKGKCLFKVYCETVITGPFETDEKQPIKCKTYRLWTATYITCNFQNVSTLSIQNWNLINAMTFCFPRSNCNLQMLMIKYVFYLLNLRIIFTHTQTFLKSTFTFFIENFKKWWCAAFNLRWSGSIKSARPWVPERVSHLIFSRTFCTIEKRGNSGNAQKKTFFFQEVFPRGGWLRISNAELMRCVLL